MKLLKKITVSALALALALSASGCGRLNISKEIARVGDRVITEAEFKYYLENVKSQMLSESGQTSTGDDNSFWEAEIEGEKASDVAKNKALDEAVRVELACIKAEEAGLSVSEETTREINAIFTSGDSSQKEQIKEIESKTGLFERLFKKALTKSALASEYAKYINENEADKITPTEEDIQSAYESDYVRVKHVLVTIDDEEEDTTADETEETPTKDPEAAKAEKKALAEDIAKKAKEGKNFESLVTEYGKDPGMESSPDGYTFAKDGSMMAEFETAAFDLEIGEVSEPVETSYGYHIIKRYPLLTSGTDYDEIKSKLQSSLMEDKYNEIIDAFKADYDIEIKTNAVNKIKVKSN